MRFDQKDYRNVLGGFATGVTVVTVFDDKGDPWGLTANSFTSVSLDPPLISICVAKKGRVFPIIAASNQFAVNVMSYAQKDLALHFAGNVENRFTGVEWTANENGSPFLPGASVQLDCSVHQRIDAADHQIILGRVNAYQQTSAAPLIYCRGQFFEAQEPGANK